MAGVTQVGVTATHRRRGLLTALMRRQLDDVRAEGREAVAALWASETVIYGRFGYGMGSLAAELRIVRSEVRWRTPPPRGGIAVIPAGEARTAIAGLHDAARRERPGMLDRAGAWWDTTLADPSEARGGAQAGAPRWPGTRATRCSRSSRASPTTARGARCASRS